MENIVKKYQQRFRKVKEEMDTWNDLQSRLLSQFTNASSIIQRLQILQDSKNYGTLRCVEGIEEAVLLKQMDSLQTILLSMNQTLENFCSVVLSLEKMVRDGRQLVKGGSTQVTVKQLQQRVGVKPSIADCLDGLKLLCEMHQSEYHLKLSVISAVALKPSATDDLGALQQLLVDQPNIPKEEVNFIFDIIFAEEMA
ncbi:PREDICTED: uncharacterized protein At5g43822-like [Nicotiana attenuata]|uniref:Casein Kinase 2 substrate n=1 Tax=Nicotiana attenuata TaxID=49451 RepID=A0A1J6KPF2_NICAT|nr:PREDICTED: uncharacterized protein At5g43822-like [Nicotiana attenuata]XP_019239380.1 PREDICTED: uncharacterized protein At5g43822-like [Nicotiana attenuata]XP_019239381.1 PREDICTED: uncharacterized protein At5g43822-like [Nicotiana attenuata]XP_019239382.1 PREDICTED: uncharacterized protein At5g43822-like [Nicotiana attenuata]XP_019239383.1 PREDICTED: uncharacterized protein At5g43822-like [Nicotiana attenuata]XP_019239384.1 PREDICTED: uncharacterized protein At5g43822-like [Nicotiana atte